MIVAITGGIGSGKSLVSDIIRKEGHFVLSCDDIVTELYKDRDFCKKLNKIFPIHVKVGKEITINRAGISKIIFTDESMRDKLNALVHPYVVKKIFDTVKKEQKELAFVEVPVLFESKLQNLFDKIIVVFRPLEERLKALKSRGLSPQESKNRIDSQVDYDRISKKDVISLDNDSDILSLECKVKEILADIIKNYK